MKTPIELISDAYQEVLIALERDLETGSRDFNDAAYNSFIKRYPSVSKTLVELGNTIESFRWKGE